MTDFLQQQHEQEQRYFTRKCELEAKQQALRDEWTRIQQADPADEARAKVREWVQRAAVDARTSLREAVNSADALKRLQKLVPPMLCVLFPREVGDLLAGAVVGDDAAKRRKLQENEAQTRMIAKAIEDLWNEQRQASAPMR